MPVLVVYGVPQRTSSLQINAYLRPGLKEAVAGISELGLSPKEVSVFLHQENTENSGFAVSQEDIVVFIDGLFEKPERTDEVLSRLARAVVEKIEEFKLTKYGKIECFVRTFNPANGSQRERGGERTETPTIHSILPEGIRHFHGEGDAAAVEAYAMYAWQQRLEGKPIEPFGGRGDKNAAFVYATYLVTEMEKRRGENPC